MLLCTALLMQHQLKNCYHTAAFRPERVSFFAGIYYEGGKCHVTFKSYILSMGLIIFQGYFKQQVFPAEKMSYLCFYAQLG